MGIKEGRGDGDRGVRIAVTTGEGVDGKFYH